MASGLFLLDVLLVLLFWSSGVRGDKDLSVLIAPTPLNTEATTDWPCGGVTSYPSTPGTNISLAANAITVEVTAAKTTISAVLGLPVGTGNYDFNTVVSLRTFDVAGFGTFCFYLGPTDGWITSGTEAVLQLIYNTGSATFYSCAKVQYLSSVSNYIPESCTNSSGMTAEYIADANQLANGSEASAGSIGRTASPSATPLSEITSGGPDPVSSAASLASASAASVLSSILSFASGGVSSASSSAASATSSASSVATSTPPSGTSSSGLSTGAKIGIGVAIPLAVIAAIILFIYLRRRRRTKRNSTLSHPNNQGTHGITDKPELSGSPYDPKIAGLVKPKPEIQGKPHPSATNSELPANAPWSHSNTGYSPPELGHNPATSEIGFAALAGGGGGAGARPSTTAGSDAGPGAPTSATGSSIARKPVGGRSSNFGGPGSASTSGFPGTNEQPDILAEEVDLLVQELGLIQMRKKALAGVAKGQGVKPEDLPGARGDDYRDLLAREVKIRRRIDEIDSMRSVS